MFRSYNNTIFLKKAKAFISTLHFCCKIAGYSFLFFDNMVMERILRMDFLSRMNQAVDYIKARLDGDIDSGKLAKIVCCDVYQLQAYLTRIY